MIVKSLALGALSALTVGALSAGIVGMSTNASPQGSAISVSRAAEAVQQMGISGKAGPAMGEVKVASFEN